MTKTTTPHHTTTAPDCGKGCGSREQHARRNPERLILPRTYYATDPATGDLVARESDLTEYGQTIEVGWTFTTCAGAPGIGTTTYYITRVDGAGAWGYVLRSTVRELDPAEVR